MKCGMFGRVSRKEKYYDWLTGYDTLLQILRPRFRSYLLNTGKYYLRQILFTPNIITPNKMMT